MFGPGSLDVVVFFPQAVGFGRVRDNSLGQLVFPPDGLGRLGHIGRGVSADRRRRIPIGVGRRRGWGIRLLRREDLNVAVSTLGIVIVARSRIVKLNQPSTSLCLHHVHLLHPLGIVLHNRRVRRVGGMGGVGRVRRVGGMGGGVRRVGRVGRVRRVGCDCQSG